MRPLALLLLVALISCQEPAGSSAPPADAISAGRIAAHVRFLADDLLEGRGVASRGEELATGYIATQFALLGLEPAGENGTYFQRVPLVGVETLATSTLVVNNRPLKLLDEFVGINQRQQQAETLDASAVFVGHGITAPEFQWDDYNGVDVRGKLVVLFTNEPVSDDPKFFGGRALTYYGRWTYKFEQATRQGALGCLIVHSDKSAGYGWSVVRNSWGGRQAEVKRGEDEPALGFAGWVSGDAGDRIFASIGKTAAEMLDQADRRGFRAIPLPVRIRGNIQSAISSTDSRNVIARLPGGDPKRRGEAVIYTAHWDHLGVGTPVNGDSIYNGAVDNATGCGILLETARAYAALSPHPARSILFAAVGAEEDGLRGSAYYAQRPAAPAGRTALNLNYDAFFPFGRTTDVNLVGYERTTLRELVERTAKGFHLTINPDPHPEQGHYYRSDHFSLARAGVPAFTIKQGDQYAGKPDGWGQKIFEEYNEKHYHQPSDHFDPAWDFSGLAELARFGFALGIEAANLEQLPSWQPGDEFLAAREKSWAVAR